MLTNMSKMAQSPWRAEQKLECEKYLRPILFGTSRTATNFTLAATLHLTGNFALGFCRPGGTFDSVSLELS